MWLALLSWDRSGLIVVKEETDDGRPDKISIRSLSSHLVTKINHFGAEHKRRLFPLLKTKQLNHRKQTVV